MFKPWVYDNLITPSNNGHNIKPLILQTKLVIEKIHSKFQKNIKKLQEIEQQLSQIWNMVDHTNEIRASKNNPEIIQIFLYPPETLPKKVCDLELVKIEILSKNNWPSLKITENISKNFNIMRSDSNLQLVKVEGLCRKNHKLLLSSDSANFYSFLNNSNSLARCDYCEKIIKGPNYHCRICSFDVCILCSKTNNFYPIKSLECNAKHPLAWTKSTSELGINSVTCDRCETSYSSSGWRCKNCDFDICIKCSENLGIQTPFMYPLFCLNNHNLLCKEADQNDYCSYCKNPISSVHWKCSSCNFSLCLFCSARAGHKVPICKFKHYLVSFVPKAKKFWRLSTTQLLCKTCCKCQKKIEEESWRCTQCNMSICMDCYMLSPINYVSY